MKTDTLIIDPASPKSITGVTSGAIAGFSLYLPGAMSLFATNKPSFDLRERHANHQHVLRDNHSNVLG